MIRWCIRCLCPPKDDGEMNEVVPVNVIRKCVDDDCSRWPQVICCLPVDKCGQWCDDVNPPWHGRFSLLWPECCCAELCFHARRRVVKCDDEKREMIRENPSCTILPLDSRNQESAQIPGFWNPMVKWCNWDFLWSKIEPHTGLGLCPPGYTCTPGHATGIFSDHETIFDNGWKRRQMQSNVNVSRHQFCMSVSLQ